MFRRILSLTALAAILLVPSWVHAQENGHASPPATTVDAKAVISAQRLKQEARFAAEQGDFATAASKIAAAADLLGNRRVAEKARKLASSAQAGGGNSFANYQELIQLIVDQTINADQDNWAAPYGNGTVGQISINSNGVLFGLNALANAIAADQSVARLNKAAELAKTANPNTDAHKSAVLRMVSLPRLEKMLAQRIREGRPVSEEIRTLAGLTRVQYLFVFPESGDVVIAGPAGDWQRSTDGRMVNAETGRPTLCLDDLAVLTQTFTHGTRAFMCTINPRTDQVKAVQQYVAANSGRLTSRNVAKFTRDVEQRLGMQDVVVQGIPADSRIASVIVDADYRMKEIGIGKRRGAAGMKSYFDLLTRSEQRGNGSMDALRWWMTVGYDHINMAPSGQVFEFSGNPVRCLSENELVQNDGTRVATGTADRANRKFAELFTEHLPQLAAQDVVFADLQNIFDLALVSALVHTQGLAQQAGWKPQGLVNDYEPATVNVPRELMTAAAYRVYRGGSIVIQVAGGVRVDPKQFLAASDRLRASAELEQSVMPASPVGHGVGRWWWDAAQR